MNKLAKWLFDSTQYCDKCGNPIREGGVCHNCVEDDIAKLQLRFKDVFTCKMCGQPKFHSRLHGYRCWNPEHNHN